MNNKQILKVTKKVNGFPSKFFDSVAIYSDEQWIATDLFPAWSGYGITNPEAWALLSEEDIAYVRFVDEENEDPKYGWIVHTHKEDSYFTLSPDQEWNSSMYPIIQEIRYKM